MKLYHRILTGQQIHGLPAFGVTTEELSQLIQGATKFVVDNVTEYVHSGAEERGIPFSIADVPNLAPPFELIWMETSRSSYMVRRDENARKQMVREAGGDVTVLTKWGALIGVLSAERFRQIKSQSTIINSGKSLDLAKWILEVAVFCEGSNGQLVAIPALRTAFVTEQGDYVGGQVTTKVVGFDMGEFESYIVPFWLSLAFLHCKNVSANEIEDVELKHRHRRWLRRQGFAALTYKTLEISPVKRQLRGYDSGHTGIRMAMHIARGHFKTFTKEKPLFGRAVGTYWWEPQVRGDAKLGEIVKEYSVKPQEILPPPSISSAATCMLMNSHQSQSARTLELQSERIN